MSDGGGTPGRISPVQRFLELPGSAVGPFALLGLTPEACSEDLVLTALDRQIERVATHPECDTPEADEVRLALHAAAAQLLDPIVRRHLIARWTGRKPVAAPTPRQARPGPATGVPGIAAVPAAAMSPLAQRMLEADAILTLALCGGWNSRSLRRLVSVAHSRGLTNEHVVATLRNLSNRRQRARPGGAPHLNGGGRPSFRPAETLPQAPAAPAPQTPAVQPSAPAIGGLLPQYRHPAVETTESRGSAVRDPGQELLQRALLFGGAGLLGLAAMIVLVIVLTRKPGTPPAPAPAPPGPVIADQPAPPERSPAPEPPKPSPKLKPPRTNSPPADPQDLASIPRELAACAEGASISGTEAADRFDSVIRVLAANWTAIPRDRLVACQDSIVEYLYRSAGTLELNLRAVSAVAEGARALAGDKAMTGPQVLPAAWSAGMLTRLSREKDLSGAAKSAVEHEANAALGVSRPAVEQTFESGLNAALAVIPHRLTPEPARGAAPDADVDVEGWRAFATAAEALAGDDAAQRQRVIFSGLEVLLINGPEPNQSRSVSQAITDVLARASWRAGEPSRAWLLRWFGDRRISNADLHAVTAALATRSSAEGVDVTMVLSTAAAENVRADLRERYATVWNLQDSVTRDELVTAWTAAARQAVAGSFGAADEYGELASAAILARLNESAFLQWRGDGGPAAALVADLRGPVDASLPDTGTIAIPPGQGAVDLSDGAWAEKYLGAKQNIKVRRELLDQLANAGIGATIGAVDAEVLCGEAISGTPAEVRSTAQEVARKYASSPAMINAVLERLPKLPKVQSAANFVEFFGARPLPSMRDPEWGLLARRSLNERLLEAVAAEGTTSTLDKLSRLLRVSYRSMASSSSLSEADRAEVNQPAAGESAALLYRAVRASAEAMVPTVAAPLTLEQIDRRRAGRLGQARGLVQAFAAEEVSLAELMGYVATVEQPARVQDIRLVLSDLAAERRRATGILRQINATERAMVQLWLIRLQQGLDGGEGAS